MERFFLAFELEDACEIGWKGDCGVEGVAVVLVIDGDVALCMGEGGFEGGQIAEVRGDADGFEAGACWLDTGDERQKIVDGVRGPCV